MKNFIFAISIIGIIVWAYSNSDQGSSAKALEKCAILSIHDGDTIRVNCNGKQERIRFACIDAPELKQDFGRESRDYLKDILKNGYVGIERISSDRYGRIIAQLWVNDKLVQELQAKAGTVWGYEQYKSNCPDWGAIQAAQRQARTSKKGLWASNPVAPWQWRRENR